MGKRDKDTITLGSGDVYIKEFTGEIPADSDIEKEDNRLGHIQGGANIEYTQETYTAEDDQGVVKKTVTTKEDVKFKTGIMTWNGNTLKKLVPTGRVTEAGNKRTIKIGGVKNDDRKYYVIRFVHKDEIDGNVRVTIVGKSTGGLALSFAKDKETVIDAEFTAKPSDAEGTLIILEEEISETA